MSKITKSFVSGILAFAFHVVAMMLAQEYETTRIQIMIRIAVIILSALFFVICNCCVEGEKNVRQLIGVDLVFLLFHLFYVISVAKLLVYTLYIVQICAELLWITSAIISIIILYRAHKDSFKCILSKIDNNKKYLMGACLFALILIISSYDADGPHFVWDANTAYGEILNVKDIPAFYLKRSFVFTHTSAAYYYPVFLFNYLIGSIKYAFFSVNAVLLIIASFSTVFLIRETLSSESFVCQMICAPICLFSPFICGISTYYSCDFGIICLAPAVLLAASRKDWVWLFVLGFVVSMMKEPGIVFFAGVCLSVLAYDIVEDRSLSVKKIVYSKRTASFICVAALFLILYIKYAYWENTRPDWTLVVWMVFAGAAVVLLVELADRYRDRLVSWKTLIAIPGILAAVFLIELVRHYGMPSSKEFGFRFDIMHIMRISKVYFILNFGWLYALIAVICLLHMKRSGIKPPKMAFVYITTAMVLFVFNCAYVTYENPRYMDAFPVCILLICVSLLSYTVKMKNIRILIFITVFVITFTSSFYSFDPISRMAFYTADVGERMLYSPTSDRDWGDDQCVYNRQYYGLDVVFDKTLAKAVDSEDDVIAVSTGRCAMNWVMDGGRYSYTENDPERVFDDFWDITGRKRVAGYRYEYRSDPNLKLLKIRYIYPADNILRSLSSEKGSFCYIYLPTQNDSKEQIIRDNCEIMEEGQFSSHGFTMAYIRGRT